MKRSYLPILRSGLVLILALICLPVFAQQNVGINTATPDASAALDIVSSNRGLLIPRLTTSERLSIQNPAEGLMVFDLTEGSFWFYFAGSWTEMVHEANNYWFYTPAATDGIYYTGGNVTIGANYVPEYQNPSGFQDRTLMVTGQNPNAGAILRLQTANSGNFLHLFSGRYADPNPAISWEDSTTLRFYTLGSNYREFLRLAPSGNIGIFNDNPQEKLDIGGNLNLNGVLKLEQVLMLHAPGITNTAVGGNALLATPHLKNTALGYEAGQNNDGEGSVFLGHQAGRSMLGSNLLVIDNQDTVAPLLLGDFAQNKLAVHGALSIRDAYTFPTTDGTDGQLLVTDGAGQLHWKPTGDLMIPDSALTFGEELMPEPGDYQSMILPGVDIRNPYSLAAYGNYAYVGTYDSLLIFDITDPANPVRLGGKTIGATYVFDIDINKDVLYLISYGSNQLYSYSLANPLDPLLLDQITAGQNLYSLEIVDTIAYVGSRYIYTINISDSSELKLSDYDYIGHYAWDLTVENGYLHYVADATAVYHFDVNDPDSIFYAGFTHISFPARRIKRMDDHLLVGIRGSNFFQYSISQTTIPFTWCAVNLHTIPQAMEGMCSSRTTGSYFLTNTPMNGMRWRTSILLT